MKRLVLGLVMMGSLALMAAPSAIAAPPGLCGHSYAILMTGGDPSVVTATGGATLPGALTLAYGVGEITFAAASGPTATSCAISGGALIYNAGDIQTNPIGFYQGPAVCYAGESALGTGVPCFDGQPTGPEMTGSLSNGGPDGAYVLSFAASYAWFDAADAPGSTPFGFWLQNTLGSSIGVGISIPGTVNTALPGNGAPVLNITLEKIGATPVGTVYGVAPYKGESALSCSAAGANDTDFVAASQAAGSNGFGPTIAGGLEMTTGSVAIFDATQIGGSLSFNANDNYVISGTPASNNDCSFAFTPAGQFADGTNNGVASITGSGSDCDDALTAGAGYSVSAVQWGTTDGDNYTMPTGLVSSATGFVPSGGESACTEYEQTPVTGNVSNLTSTTIVAVNNTAHGYVKVTNPTEADCDIEIAMPSTSNTYSGTAQDAACTGLRAPYACCTSAGHGTCVDETCSLNLTGNPVSADAPGPAPAVQLGTTNCTCSGLNANSTSSTLTLSSVQCGLFGATSHVVTCKN